MRRAIGPWPTGSAPGPPRCGATTQPPARTRPRVRLHPSILVPYPYAADDHQTRNGEVFANAGASEMVQERDLDAEKLASMAASILRDLPTYKRMAKAARDLAVPDAADRVCDAIEASLATP